MNSPRYVSPWADPEDDGPSSASTVGPVSSATTWSGPGASAPPSVASVELTAPETPTTQPIQSLTPARPAGRHEKKPLLVRMSDVKPEAVQWLWPGRIARGKLHLLIGDPGVGKSTLTLAWAACLSTGGRWPDSAQAPCGDVVLMTCEDGLADTVRPRLGRFGADLARVTAFQGVIVDAEEREGPVSLATDLAVLEKAIVRTGAICVIIDPLSAYLPGVDTHKDAAVRSVLGPLAKMAERLNVAIVAIMHMTKEEERDALKRALGSIAFVGASRVVLALGRDPNNPERRVLAHVKNNLTKPTPSLAYTIPDEGDLRWEGAVSLDAAAVLGVPTTAEEISERDRAAGFLIELLAKGPVAAEDVLAAANEHDLAERTVRRAGKRIGIRPYREGGLGRAGRWMWSLPANATSAG